MKAKQGWALVQRGGLCGMKDVVVSTHRTKDGADTAMIKKGGEPDSEFQKGFTVQPYGIGTGRELVSSEFTGKFLRPVIENQKGGQT